jgi:predicted nucleotidyltransferase
MHDSAAHQQITGVVLVLQAILGANLTGAYLHGSIALGGLGPDSDLDILLVLSDDPSKAQRKEILSSLLNLSQPFPRPTTARRCIEVIAYNTHDLAQMQNPMRAAFLYGEWLRAEFLAGAGLVPFVSPDNLLIAAQAGQNAKALLGPDLVDLLPPVPITMMRDALAQALPHLLASLTGDERNVLLTLARMWRSAAHGDFLPKDKAAYWAADRLQGQNAALLVTAAKAYRGKARDNYDKSAVQVAAAADYLAQCIRNCLAAPITSP